MASVDWSVDMPDLCWFVVCDHLPIWSIAQLAATCRALRHLLWSEASSLWPCLIYSKCGSEQRTLAQSLVSMLDESQTDIFNVIGEHGQFAERLAQDAKLYQSAFEKYSMSESVIFAGVDHFTAGRTSIRGFAAGVRKNPMRWSSWKLPPPWLIFRSVPLSSNLFRQYYQRATETTATRTPIGAFIYAYLTDKRRRLAARDLRCAHNCAFEAEQPLRRIEDDGSVCVTSPYFITRLTLYPWMYICIFTDGSSPIWADLLPGQYNLVCRMRLRRQAVTNDNVNGIKQFMRISLLGDRAVNGGCTTVRHCTWFEKQHQKYGDDNWFSADLTQFCLVLHDISNVYLNIDLSACPAVAFLIWIDTIQLNFCWSNSHRHMYTSQSESTADLIKLMLQLFVEPLLYKYHVDLNLYAHRHSYERSCPMFQKRCVDDGFIQILIGMAGQNLDSGTYSGAHWNIYHDQQCGYTTILENQTVMTGSLIRCSS